MSSSDRFMRLFKIKVPGFSVILFLFFLVANTVFADVSAERLTIVQITCELRNNL